MADWYLDLIPCQAGARPEAAVNRVYPGFTDENPGGVPFEDLVSDDPPVTREVRRWMKSVVDQLLQLDVGLEVTGFEREPGCRWPFLIELESELGALFIRVWPNCLTIRPLGYPESDQHWRSWWTVIRHFARQRYVAVHSDPMEIWSVHVSDSVQRARAVAALF